jgi:hypothetical protein
MMNVQMRQIHMGWLHGWVAHFFCHTVVFRMYLLLQEQIHIVNSCVWYKKFVCTMAT